MLRLPLTSVLLATLLLASDGVRVMPLAIVAVVVSYVVTARPAYLASFGTVTLPSFVAGGSYQVSVPVTNAGPAQWPAQAAVSVNAVTLSYHWHDAVTGATILWDGTRTPLVANVDPGATVAKACGLQVCYNAHTRTLCRP